MKCEQKTSYASQQEAQLALKEIHIKIALDETKKRKYTPKREYRCEFCRLWHLTSKTKAKYKENKHLSEIKKVDRKIKEDEFWEEQLEKNKRIKFK